MLKPVHFIFCVIIMVISSMLCFPSFLTISYCFLGYFYWFPPVFPLFPISDFASNIDLPNFCFEFTPAEARIRGTMIYIHKNLEKLRKDLNIYNPKAIESMFIEVINDKRLNTIIGFIYKHPKTTVNEFANDFMILLLGKLSLKQRDNTSGWL